MAGPAGAQESEPLETASSGTVYAVFEWNPLTFADNPVSSFRGTSQGTDNVSGSHTCSAAGTNRYLGPGEPPAADVEGVCDPASAFIWSYGSYDYSPAECRLENTGQIFTFDLSGTVVSCVPFSCFGDPLITEEGAELYLPKVGCTFSAFYTQTGMSEDGTSTIETVEKLTYEQVEWDADRSLVVARTRSTTTGMGTITLNPEAELPAGDVAIEVPAEGSTMSGIGVISGWSCLGGILEAEFRNADGEVLATFPLGPRTPRADTESVCGDTLNGFSATMNWNLLPAGEASIHLIQNGEELASWSFSVLAFGEEFLTGMWTTTVPDFPAAGQSATLEWDASQQRFVVAEIN